MAVDLTIVTVPEFAPPTKSLAVVVPLLVQYRTVSSGTLVVVIIYVTVCPSLILVTLGIMVYLFGALLVSLIVTVGLVATTGPEYASVLNSNIIVSSPSFELISFFNTLLMVPVLLIILTVDEFIESIKSPDIVVPLLVQNIFVLFGTFVVVIVYLTVPPSLTDWVSGVIVYVDGDLLVSTIDEFDEFDEFDDIATIGPVADPFSNLKDKVSTFSVN